MIPKTIHYCWFGGKKLSKSTEKYISSWKKYCPDYKVVEWNESNFDVNSHQFVKSAYEEGAWAFVSDYVRLKVIYEYGGIYFDTDVELLKNIDFLLDNECFVGIQQGGKLCTTGLGYGAVKKNKVVYGMLRKYDEIQFNLKEKENLAFPSLHSDFFKNLGYKYLDIPQNINGLLILPPKYMDPLSPGNSLNLLCDESISIHHYSASWTSKKNIIKRNIFNTIGLDKVQKIKKIIRWQHN